MQLRAFRRARRANISVEMALIGSFVLLPVVAGGADFLQLIAAKAKLNATLPAFYAFAWNNPASATDTAQLGGILSIINQQSGPPVTFPDGVATGATTYHPAISYRCSVPPSVVQTVQATPCPAGDVQAEFVTYNVMSKVVVSVPLPFGLATPFQLSASGQVQVQ
jgi:Flp pilus assembly protein TadG